MCVELARWFRVVFSIFALSTLTSFIFIIEHLSRPSTVHGIAGIVFALTILGLVACLVPYQYFVYLATASGIERKGLLRRRQEISWSSIVRVSESRFVKGVVYIIADDGDKIVLLKGMPHYAELLGVIQARASRLSPPGLPRSVWPTSKSWRQLWIVVAAVLVIVVVMQVLGVYFLWQLDALLEEYSLTRSVGGPQLEGLRRLEHADPAEDLKDAIKMNDLRFLGIAGYGVAVPGAETAAHLHEKYGVKIIEGTGDVIFGPEHGRLIGVAGSYARRYNGLLLKYLQSKNQ